MQLLCSRDLLHDLGLKEEEHHGNCGWGLGTWGIQLKSGILSIECYSKTQ